VISGYASIDAEVRFTFCKAVSPLLIRMHPFVRRDLPLRSVNLIMRTGGV
jgi:hypothetical protein